MNQAVLQHLAGKKKLKCRKLKEGGHHGDREQYYLFDGYRTPLPEAWAAGGEAPREGFVQGTLLCGPHPEGQEASPEGHAKPPGTNR